MRPAAPLIRLTARRQSLTPTSTRQFASSSFLCRAFEDGDVVILREKRDRSHDGVLLKLRPSKTFSSHRGQIEHADILGKQPRQVVLSSKGTAYRLHEPTLAEYVRLTPRIVTPIYPMDANLIVSLLDLHVDTFSPTAKNDPPLEILEAGTGHGALTLHLSRAIHAANAPIPKAPSNTHSLHTDEPEDTIYLGESVSDLQETGLESWKASRRAIVHTLDISSKHSKHAKTIVQGFRHGMYARNVDFHVGDVSAWIASQKIVRETEEPFLSHVFLDLPNAELHLANVASALRVNGLLAVFNPSITQIAACVDTIRESKMPFILDQVLELGGGNIRQWDVRAVRPRATLKQSESTPKETGDELQAGTGAPTDAAKDAIEGQEARDGELAEELSKQEEKWVMVCRPKLGEVVVAGGFLGLWRRMEQVT